MFLNYLIYITISLVLIGLMGGVLKFTMAGFKFVQSSGLKIIDRLSVLTILSVVFCFTSVVCGYILKLALQLIIN